MKLTKFQELFDIFKENIFDFYLNNPISEKYRLQKIDKRLTVVDIDKVKEITMEHYIEKDKVFVNVENDNVKMILENFINVMNNNFDEKDLGNLYDNIIWVLFKKYISRKYDGDYDPVTNIIRTLSEKDNDSINHELIHMSANPYDETNDYGGFYYTIDKYMIGYGLDEGYTELLNKRYFNSKTQNAYRLQIMICRYLEELVGQKKMEKMYLNANLFGLIKELKQTHDTKEIERFIAAIDFTHDYDNVERLADCEMDALYSQIETVIIFLFKRYCKKMLNKELPAELLEHQIIEYLDKLIKDFEFPVDQYVIDKLNKIIQENVNKNIKLDINTFKEQKNVL